eukprot:g76691.t1
MLCFTPAPKKTDRPQPPTPWKNQPARENRSGAVCARRLVFPPTNPTPRPMQREQVTFMPVGEPTQLIPPKQEVHRPDGPTPTPKICKRRIINASPAFPPCKRRIVAMAPAQIFPPSPCLRPVQYPEQSEFASPQIEKAQIDLSELIGKETSTPDNFKAGQFVK